jgi:predicted metalloprotease with PDZ domain
MRHPVRSILLIASLVVATRGSAAAQTDAVAYRVTFPEPEHHWLQVEATFPDAGRDPLVVRMSRSSPGRYAVHEFAKNIFSFEAFDGQGRALRPVRLDADSWRIDGHDTTVRVVYRLFGDEPDGTYLGIDTTHAHINMPAAFLWADGLDARPIRLTFVPPAGSAWRTATQLFATSDPFSFTAPNLQYFMDSPVELADLVVSTFEVTIAGRTSTFRVAAHSDGSQQDIDAFAASIARLIREQAAVYGELPDYEPGAYTFLFDFVGWAGADGMEHRNSTSISFPNLSMRTAEGRLRALDIVSHEFFHAWNVERIRPAGIEPFDFTRENVTCCLWLAEGFTEYYGPLLLTRAGLTPGAPTEDVAQTMTSPARGVRSAVEMSEQAPFADAGIANDLTDRDRTYTSYYTQGSALALALDLSLRERTAGRVTLDDYMRRLWQVFGAPPGPRPGYVARAYTLTDLRAELATVSGDRGFADGFFDRYIEGRDTPDFVRLLGLAGFNVQPAAPGRGWIGDVRTRDISGGLIIGIDATGRRGTVSFRTPLYDAGIDEGDVITAIDGRPASRLAWSSIANRKPGERMTFTVRRRDGRQFDAMLTVGSDPRVTIEPLEASGGTPTAAQLAFRQAWLASRAQPR